MWPQSKFIYELHKMCISRLETVRDNMDTLVDDNWPEAYSVNVMNTFDAYVSSLIDVSSLSQKFILQVMLYSKNKKNNFQILLDNLQEYGQTMPSQIALPGIEAESVETEHENEIKTFSQAKAGRSMIYSTQEATYSESDHEKSSCGTQHSIDLSKYTSGYILKASVTFIKDLSKLSFYACDQNNAAMPSLKKLSCCTHLRQFTGLPPKKEIFGLVLEEMIVRGLLYETQSSTNNLIKKSSYTVQLIDFGDVVDVDLSYITYLLLPEHKRIPPQALFCHLHSIEPHNELSQKEQQTILKQLLFTASIFEVVSINSGVLELKLLQRKSENKPLEAFKSEEQHAVAPPGVKKQETPLVKSTQKKIPANPFLSCSKDESASEECNKLVPLKQLDSFQKNTKGLPQLQGLMPDEWKMPYEEPACTSHAMKAVHGYNPKDDKRLCRFIDAKTGNCFRRLEHNPLHPKGWTKDNAPAASTIYKHNPTVRYSKGAIINITPTFVDHMHYFYAQINDPKEPMTPQLWDDNVIPQWKRMNQMPLMYDVVLAKFEDGMWYRARVVEAKHASNEVVVFYIDYGNQQRVPLRDCARCDDVVAHLPSQADLFFISDVCDCHNSLEKRKSSIDMLRQAILSKKVNVEIVSQCEDITIRFIDKPIITVLDKIKKLFI